MKKINIKQKLSEIGVSVDDISLGDFDYIGKYTAERHRTPDQDMYKKVGCFFRSNFERGILIYHLIKKYRLTSMLEIGFGRGYSTFCAAKAFADIGVNGKIVTIDPKFDFQLLNQIKSNKVFPASWFECINFVQGTSVEALPGLQNEKFDLVYIDGDHSYEGTKFDWEHTKDLYNKFLLFDDYHEKTKNDAGIQCQKLIDEIEDSSKELIIMDRRIFFDDRRMSDEEINYGQVLLTKD